MIRSIITEIQRPETGVIYWGFALPFGMIASYAIAVLALGILPVTTLREVDIDQPDAFSFFMAWMIAGIVMIWVVTRNMWSALIDLREEAKQDRSKRAAADTTTVRSLLRLDEQSHQTQRPIWAYSLLGLGIIIIMDAVALAAGRSDSLPLGLDRLEDAVWYTWLLGTALLLVVRPVIEQIIFQGILYPVIVKQFDDNGMAILLTAVAFTVFYFAQVAGSGSSWAVTYWGIIFPFVLGLCASTARAASKSTIAAIGVQSAAGLFLMLSAAVTYLI